jgi:hypothetical protein
MIAVLHEGQGDRHPRESASLLDTHGVKPMRGKNGLTTEERTVTMVPPACPWTLAAGTRTRGVGVWPRRCIVAWYWKKHVCVGCGAAFRYSFGRLKARPARTPRASMKPCPTCGLYQPDMVAGQRMTGHILSGVFGFGAALALAITGVTLYFPDRVTMWLGVAVGTATVLGHFLVALRNPNRDTAANRERARQMLRSGDLERLRGETPDLAAGRLPRWGLRPVHAVALVGMALGNVLFVAADLARLACGWPMNPQWHPGVVGPGDTSRLYFDEGFGSVKGLWRGKCTAWTLNERELGLGPVPLKVTTNQDMWGNVIWFDQGKESNNSVDPWVEVRVPDSPQIAGKRLDVRAELIAEFPVWHFNHFDNEQRTLTRTAALQIAATPGAGAIYRKLWHGGAFAAAAGLGLMSLILTIAAWSMSRHANPVTLVRERDKEDEDPDDEEFGELERRDRRRRRRYYD